MVHKNFFSRALLVGTMAGGLAMAMGAVPARADRRDDNGCRDRVAKAQIQVDRDAARRGDHSRQVSDDLRRLDAAREWCGKHHADWDHGRDRDYDRYRNVDQRSYDQQRSDDQRREDQRRDDQRR
jgi:hypothetical protein